MIMVRGKIRIVAHRRRREGRTNFHKRLELVKSGKKRLVVRKTTSSLVCQIVDYQHSGDRVIASATTKDLSSFGWNGGTGNLPSSYLVGYLCGMRAKESKVKDAILDMGIQRSTKGSRIYAALKGALDSGLNVPCSEEILPSEERIRGLHIENIASSNQGMFSGIKKSGLDAQKIGKHFDEVKAKISSAKHFRAEKPAAKKAPAKEAKTTAKKPAAKKTEKGAAKKSDKKPAEKKAKK